MAADTIIRPAPSGVTERFDPTTCVDERTRSRSRTADPVEPGRYLQVQGPEREILIPLAEAPIHIGRGLNADLRLDEASVSRRHAIVMPRPTGARILDDRSSNGTLVNGRRVQQAELRDGDVIMLGRIMLRYIEF